MKSLLNPADSQSYINRINCINPTNKPLWGKMSVDQMLAHCNAGLEKAMVTQPQKRILLGYIFGPIAKKKLFNNEPFKKGLPTAKDLVRMEHYNFEEEKSKLLELVAQYTRGGQAGITKYPHSFFGKLTVAQWDNLMTKHLEHHLQQFGL